MHRREVNFLFEELYALARKSENSSAVPTVPLWRFRRVNSISTSIPIINAVISDSCFWPQFGFNEEKHTW